MKLTDTSSSQAPSRKRLLTNTYPIAAPSKKRLLTSATPSSVPSEISLPSAASSECAVFFKKRCLYSTVGGDSPEMSEATTNPVPPAPPSSPTISPIVSSTIMSDVITALGIWQQKEVVKKADQASELKLADSPASP